MTKQALTQYNGRTDQVLQDTYKQILTNQTKPLVTIDIPFQITPELVMHAVEIGHRTISCRKDNSKISTMKQLAKYYAELKLTNPFTAWNRYALTKRLRNLLNSRDHYKPYTTSCLNMYEQEHEDALLQPKQIRNKYALLSIIIRYTIGWEVNDQDVLDVAKAITDDSMVLVAIN